MRKPFLPLLLLGASLSLASCGESGPSSSSVEGMVSVSFDTCTTLPTNEVRTQWVPIGGKADRPAVAIINDPNYEEDVEGWYREPSYATRWDFDSDVVSESMTLYARWAKTVPVFYYLSGSDTPIWTVWNAFPGHLVDRHEELCDGYRIDGYYSDQACTVPFDFDAPITGETSVYIKRSESIYLSPQSIARRFSPYAAGGAGSQKGSIATPVLGEDGIESVSVNFGYSTSADPYILLTNPRLDLSSSQKVRMKFKNRGAAYALKFYWTALYEDGEYVLSAQSFNESEAFNYTFSDIEKNMTDEDPYLEKEFDLSSIYKYGVSLWGNSKTLVQLRVQSCYVSKSLGDESNVLQIASIEGVSDDSHVGTSDTFEEGFLSSDEESVLAEASASQSPIDGFLFPLDRSSLASRSAGKVFHKKDGALLYGAYRSGTNTFRMNAACSVSLDEKTTLRVSLRNYSYITSLRLVITNASKKSCTVTLPIKSKDSTLRTYEVNMYGRSGYFGDLSHVDLSFVTQGVDNAIELSAIEFADYRAIEVPGFNFDDPLTAGFASSSSVDVSFASASKATRFDVKESGGSVSKSIDADFSILGYQNVSLKYRLLSASLTKATLRLVIDGWSTSSYEFALEQGDGFLEATLPLENTGSITSASLLFEGTGSIELTEIRFHVPASTSVDFSSGSLSNGMSSQWKEFLSYDDSIAAHLHSGQGTTSYYFGFLYGLGRRETGNIPLFGKSKLVMIYQNRVSARPNLGYGLTRRDAVEDPDTAVTYPKSETTDHSIHLNNSMPYGSWSAYSVSIPSTYTQDDSYVLTSIALTFGTADNAEIYLRAIMVI